MIINQQNVGIHFLMKNVLQQQFLYRFTWSSNQFLFWTPFLSFFFFFFWLQILLFINSISLCFDHLLAKLFPSFRLFLVLFWILWTLVFMEKSCHVPRASWLTTSGTIFREIFFGVSKEWVRSWSHTVLISNLKTLAKNLLAVHLAKGTRRKKRRKTRMTIAKI